jgi:membrane-bound lytic murein transglycosylase D
MTEKGIIAMPISLALLLLLAIPASLPAADQATLLREFSAAVSEKKIITASLASPLEKSLELSATEPAQLDEPVSPDIDAALLNEHLPDADIPLTLNSKVNYFIDYFQNRGRNSFARWLSRSERYIPMMKEILRKEGLPEDLVYLAMIESGFTPHAVSVANAVGPWQFISGTGKRYDLKINDWIDERRDPIKSTVAAALYLKELYALFNNDWYLAAAGYNAGENKILRAITMYDTRDFWEISKGSYLKRETKDYVPKLLAAAIIAKEPAKYGFADVAYLPAMDLDTVEVPTRTDLELVARLTGVTEQTLKELNPELRRWCTPPDYPTYLLKLPKGKKELFITQVASIPEDQRFVERVTYSRYWAKKKDTLKSIAIRFNTTPERLAELNRLKSTAKLRGKSLVVPVQVAAAKKPNTEAVVAKTDQPEAVGSVEKKEENRYYTVKKGDTLYSLARKFKVTTAILSAWNNLAGKVALQPGRRLIVAKNSSKDNV